MKKVLGLVIAILFTISQIPIFAQFEINIDNDLSLLESLGFFEYINTDNHHKKLSRAEMAAIAVSIYKGIDFSNSENIYSDVPIDHPLAHVITSAYKMGIISGVTHSMFRPDETVTMLDAIVMLIRAAGYNDIAIAKGGYTTGYQIVANDIGLLDGIDISFFSELTLMDIVAIIKNLLDVELPNLSIVNQENRYEIFKEKTILTERLKVNKAMGIIIDNGYTSLYGPSQIPKDCIMIGEDIFRVGNSNAQDFLGYNVELYYDISNKSDTPTIIYTLPVKNIKRTLYASQLTDVSKTKIKYMVNDYYETVNLNERLDVIYNGRYIDPWDIDDLFIKQGRIDLVDNNLDALYDVIFINTYETYFVDSVSNARKTIYDRAGKNPLFVDIEDKDIEINIKKNNLIISLEDIKAKDIATVVASQNRLGNKKLEIYINDEVISGVIHEVDEEWLTVGEQEYKMNGQLFSDYASGKISIEVGMRCKLYLDYYGEVAAFENMETAGINNTSSYGYLIDATLTKGSLSDIVEFKIYCSDGVIRIFPSANKVKFFNGADEKVVTGRELLMSEDFKTTMDYYYEDNDTRPVFKSQLIYYTLNESNFIEQLRLASYSHDKSSFSLDKILSDDHQLSAQGMIFNTKSSTEERYLLQEGKTIIFSVPKPDKESCKIDEELFSLLRVSNLPQLNNARDSSTNTYYYNNAKLYDIDNTQVAGALVVWAKPSANWTQQANVLIIKSRRNSLDPKTGEVVLSISGIMGNTERNYVITRRKTIEALKDAVPGEMYQIVVNPENTAEMLDARRVFAFGARPNSGYSNHTLYLETGGFVDPINEDRGPVLSNSFFAIGTIEEKNENVITVRIDGIDFIVPYFIKSYTYVNIVDISKSETMVRKGTANEIGKGDLVFIQSRSSNLRDLILIKR